MNYWLFKVVQLIVLSDCVSMTPDVFQNCVYFVASVMAEN